MVPGRGPQDTAVKLWTGPPHLKAGPRLEGPLVGWLPRVAVAGGLRAPWAPPQRGLRGLTTWQLAPPARWSETARRGSRAFDKLVSAETHHHSSYSVRSVSLSLAPLREENEGGRCDRDLWTH